MGIFNGKSKTGNRFIRLAYVDGIQGMSPKEQITLTHDRSKGILEIKVFLSRQAPYTLSTAKITNIEYITDREIYEKGKSVIGRAAAGAVLFGNLGAVIGGISGTGKKTKSKLHHYIVITYISNGTEKLIAFEEETPQIGILKMISEIKQDAGVQPQNREL